VSALAGRLADKRIVICAGAGGVGKTTVSAAVALGLASRGRRVALVTIDPARRLAEALGLDRLDNEPRRIDGAVPAGGGLELSGELSAMMLDVKRTFDELITLLAPDVATREAIFANPIYEQLSTLVAGSQEYSAIAKLFELAQTGSYDVIVLDTPPSRNAIDFLRAPDRLTGFLESHVLAVFLTPTGHMFRAAEIVFAAVRRITGVGLLDDLTTFFRLLSGLLDGLGRRAGNVQRLLVDEQTVFLVVTSSEHAPLDEAIFLARELQRNGMHRAGVIVNRVHPLDEGPCDVATTARRLASTLGARLSNAVAVVHEDVQQLARRDDAALARLRATLGDPAPVSLFDRERDLHDIAQVAQLAAEVLR